MIYLCVRIRFICKMWLIRRKTLLLWREISISNCTELFGTEGIFHKHQLCVLLFSIILFTFLLFSWVLWFFREISALHTLFALKVKITSNLCFFSIKKPTTFALIAIHQQFKISFLYNMCWNILCFLSFTFY